MTAHITRSRVMMLGGNGPTQYLLNLCLEIEHAYFLPGTDIHNLPACRRTSIKFQSGPRCIGDVCIIARLLSIAEEGKGPPFKCAAQHRWNNTCILLVILPRAIIIEWTHNERVHAKGSRVGTDKVISRRFTGRVGCQWVKRVILAHGDESGRTIGFRRREVYQRLKAALT